MRVLGCEACMIFKQMKLSGAFVIELEKVADLRGYFARSWCRREFAAHGIDTEFLQANTALNHRRGTLRGLHYQVAPYEEIKLVRCGRGSIFDVIIDLRPGSESYKQWAGVELSQDNQKMVYVPAGFAHGYQALENHTEVTYLVSQVFSPEHERGVRWNDPVFSIEWPQAEHRIISEKDKQQADYTE